MGMKPEINDKVVIRTSNGLVVAYVCGITKCYYNEVGYKIDIIKDGIVSSNIEPSMVKVLKKAK